MFGSAFPTLLMDQVKIAQGRLLVRHPLEQNAFGNDLVGRRNGIVAGIKNLPGAEFVELYLLSWNRPIYDQYVAWGRNRIRSWQPLS